MDNKPSDILSIFINFINKNIDKDFNPQKFILDLDKNRDVLLNITQVQNAIRILNMSREQFYKINIMELITIIVSVLADTYEYLNNKINRQINTVLSYLEVLGETNVTYIHTEGLIPVSCIVFNDKIKNKKLERNLLSFILYDKDNTPILNLLPNNDEDNVNIIFDQIFKSN